MGFAKAGDKKAHVVFTKYQNSPHFMVNHKEKMLSNDTKGLTKQRQTCKGVVTSISAKLGQYPKGGV